MTFGGIVLLLFAAYFCTYGEICRDDAYVDENTASFWGERVWLTGQHTGRWYHPSPLESYLEERWPGMVEHRWTQCAGTGKSLFGRSVSFGHGAPGGALHLERPLLQAWIPKHSPDEILALYQSLSKADRPTSEAIVDRVIAEARGW